MVSSMGTSPFPWDASALPHGLAGEAQAPEDHTTQSCTVATQGVGGMDKS